MTHSVARLDEQDTAHEGTRLGLIIGTAIWVWLAVIDVIAGEPFHTFDVLGGVLVFTVLHYLLSILYGKVVVATVRGAENEPSLSLAVAFGFLMLQCAFAMMTVLLSHLGLGDLAWLRIFGGSVLAAAIALVVITRRFPFAAELRRAEVES